MVRTSVAKQPLYLLKESLTQVTIQLNEYAGLRPLNTSQIKRIAKERKKKGKETERKNKESGFKIEIKENKRKKRECVCPSHQLRPSSRMRVFPRPDGESVILFEVVISEEEKCN